MMPTQKKRLLWAGTLFTVLAAIAAFAVIFIANNLPSDWKRLYELKEYKGLEDSQISEIRLRKAVDSADWAVFSDEDLIQTWVTVLNAMEVKRNGTSKSDFMMNGGGGLFVTIKTGAETYYINFINDPSEYQLKIDRALYDIKDPEAIPFEETFDEAIARHGVKTPWD